MSPEERERIVRAGRELAATAPPMSAERLERIAALMRPAAKPAASKRGRRHAA